MENTLPFLSANCLTENGVVMASTKAAACQQATCQAKPLPVGSPQKLVLALWLVSSCGYCAYKVAGVMNIIHCSSCISVLDAALEKLPT